MDCTMLFTVIGGAGAVIIPVAVWGWNMLNRPRIEILKPTSGIWYIYPREINEHGDPTVAGTASYEQVQILVKRNNIDPMPRLFIHVPVHNKTKTRWGKSTARQINARVLFNELDVEPKRYGYNARWKETDQPKPLEDKTKYQYIDIPPDEERILDIAFRKTDEKTWFAWNNDNYDNPLLMEIGNGIGEDSFKFRVIVTGDNIKTVEKSFRVSDGKGKIEFFELDKKGNDK